MRINSFKILTLGLFSLSFNILLFAQNDIPVDSVYNPVNECKIGKCDTLNAFSKKIKNSSFVLDGRLDENEWKIDQKLNYVSVNVNINPTGANQIPENAIGNFATNNIVTWGTMWDDNNLYIGVKVIDQSLVHRSWGGTELCGLYGIEPNPPLYDAIELFITPENRFSLNSANFFHFIKPVDLEESVNDFWRSSCEITNTKFEAKSIIIDSGYTIEFKLPWESLGYKAVRDKKIYLGKTLRIDIANDDADLEGSTRNYQTTWNNYCGNQNYQDNIRYGLLSLVDENLPGGGLKPVITGPGFVCDINQPVVYNLVAPNDKYFWSVTPESGYFPDARPIAITNATGDTISLIIKPKTGLVATVVFVQRGLFEVAAATNSGCQNQDNPLPFKVKVGSYLPRINGQGSVCLGQKNMEYFLTFTYPGYKYTWYYEGAEKVTSFEGTANTVDWQDVTQKGIIKVYGTDTNGCKSEDALFYMRINDSLYIKRPTGPDKVCNNPLEIYPYSITGFVNSKYEWEIIGGAIKGDTNTNKVNIDWGEQTDIGFVRAIVQSVDYPNCFGESDSLRVRVITQPVPPNVINIYEISTSKENDKDIYISIKWEKSSIYSMDSLFLYRSINNEDFVKIAQLQQYDWRFFDKNLNTSDNIYRYYLTNSLTCNFDVSSVVQNSTLLKILKDDESGKISLSWNPVTMWAKGINKYQIFKKVDNKDWELAQETTNTTAEFVKEGFKHQYRVLALSNEFFLSKPAEIYTNIVYADFLNTVEILGNVLTPNNDNVNDAFVIKNITSYPVRNLKIYNRWGGEILQTSNYNNDWNANNQPDGMYYYHLEYGIDSPSETKKGWIQVIR